MKDDAISRQAVLEQTYKWSKDEFLRVTNPFDYLRKRILSLPSVSTEKTGRWIEHKPNGIEYIVCSKCSVWFLRSNLIRNSYCPNCGAKMEVEE